MNKQKMLKRIALFLGGIFILTVGVALQINANLGIGCWDSVNVGLHESTSISVGTFAFMVGVIMVIIAGCLRGFHFRIMTLVTAFFMGSFTDLSIYLLRFLPINYIGMNRYVFLILGIIITSFGIALYLLSNLPPNAVDDCTLAIKEKFNLNIGVAKLLLDISGLLVALFIQGPIGIGTLFITLLVGPFVSIFDRLLRTLHVGESK